MIGVLMLDTRFPRPVGDIGNPASFDVPVLYETVPLASPELVVRGDPTPLLPDFIAAGRRLVDQGAQVISTSCGFLTLFQQQLSEALDATVVTSSLLAVAQVQSDLPQGQTVGILTISKNSLTPAHLDAAGVPQGVPIGAPEGTFATAILGNAPDFEMDTARQEHVDAARTLQRNHSNIGAFVLECTNMGPYARAIAHATGLPLHSIITVLAQAHAAQKS